MSPVSESPFGLIHQPSLLTVCLIAVDMKTVSLEQVSYAVQASAAAISVADIEGSNLYRYILTPRKENQMII